MDKLNYHTMQLFCLFNIQMRFKEYCKKII